MAVNVMTLACQHVDALGAHCALCVHCAKSGAIFDPFSPMAKVIAVTTVFPSTGLPRFLLSPKTKTVKGGVQGGQGKTNLLLGALRALCRNAAFVESKLRTPRQASFSCIWNKELQNLRAFTRFEEPPSPSQWGPTWFKKTAGRLRASRYVQERKNGFHVARFFQPVTGRVNRAETHRNSTRGTMALLDHRN